MNFFYNKVLILNGSLFDSVASISFSVSNYGVRSFSSTRSIAADEARKVADEARKVATGLDFEQERKRLSEDGKVASGHYDALRNLEKGKKLTQQDQEFISNDKEEYEGFFDTDSDSEVTGKTVSWEKNKVGQVMEYIKGEKSANAKAYKDFASENPDVFNVLNNKVTGNTYINIKPHVLKNYKHNSEGNQDDPDQPSTNTQITQNKTDIDPKNIDIKGKGKADTSLLDSDAKNQYPQQALNDSISREEPLSTPTEFILSKLEEDHSPIYDDGGD